MITVLWMVIGYSIAFTGGGATGMQPYIGSFKYFLLAPLNDDINIAKSSGADHSRDRLHVLPDDLRDHHPGADRRRAGRPDEVLGVPAVHVLLADLRLLPDRPLGVGRRLARRHGRAGLRRRHRRAPERRHRGPRHRPDARQAQRARHRELRAVQPGLRPHRRLAAVGRLVRVQRRLGGRGSRRHRRAWRLRRRRSPPPPRRWPGCSWSGSSPRSPPSSAWLQARSPASWPSRRPRAS